MTRIAINEALMFLRQRRPLTSISHCGNEDVETPSVLDPPDEHPTPERSLQKPNSERLSFKQFLASGKTYGA